MPEHIDPAAIPGATLDPDTVEISANQLRLIGNDVATNGATVLTSWQGISAVYTAPESGTLFGVMDPVKTLTEGVSSDISTARDALAVFAEEARPIKAELEKIRAEAVAFVGSIKNGVDVEVANPAYMGGNSYSFNQGADAADPTMTQHKEWHEDQASVDKNNDLINRVSAQMVLLWAAERKCANAIYDILGYPHIEAATDANPNGYGVEEIPDDAETPWGTPVEKTEDCGEKVVGAVKGFVWDGVIVGGIWGTVQGLGSLTLGYNPATGEWFQGDVYAAGWSNMGMLAVGLVSVGPLGGSMAMMPGPVGDFFRGGQEALLNAGKGLIAWDQWAEDPAAAAGTAVFNVASIVIPAGAALSGVKAGASTTAAAIRSAAAVMDVIDPASLVVKVGGAGIRVAAPAISDLLKGMDFGSLTHVDEVSVKVPHVDLTTSIDAPHGGYDVPNVVDHAPANVTATVPEPALVHAGGDAAVHVGGDAAVHTGGDAAVHTGGDTAAHTGGDAATHTGGGNDLVSDSGAPYGRDPEGQPYGSDDWQGDYTDADGQPVYGDGDGTPAGVTPDAPVAHDLQTAVADGNIVIDADGVPRLADEIDVDFSRKTDHDPAEFRLQLDEQQAGFDNMTIQDFVDRRGSFLEFGRSSAGDAAQTAARAEALAEFVERYIDEHPDADLRTAEAAGQAELSAMHPLHAPDQVAGGDPANIVRMGDARVNSSIGAQWRTRIPVLEAQVLDLASHLDPSLWDDVRLNIRLNG